MPQNALTATFAAYNQAIWPVQVALLLVALALVGLALRAGAASGRLAYGGLALLWAWCGAVFWLAFYTRHNPPRPVGYAFGIAFLLQAALFARAAVAERGSRVALRNGPEALLGGVLIAFALLAYPYLASVLGQHYPAQPTFGAPCPLTIFTFGMLLLVTGRAPGHLLAIPFVWALLGIFPVLRFGMQEDIGLIVAGLVALPVILLHNRRVGAAATDGVGETPASQEGIRRLH